MGAVVWLGCCGVVGVLWCGWGAVVWLGCCGVVGVLWRDERRKKMGEEFQGL